MPQERDQRLASTAKSYQRLQFFELLFSDTEGILCIATTDPRAPKTTFTQQYFDWPRESIKVENYILKVERHHNVYFCINLLNKYERKKEHCQETDLLWADLDTINPDTIADYPPPIVMRSSPGRWQAIWRLTAKIPPFQAEDYSRRLSYHLGADKSGWDLTQLLRVPMTVNRKYDTPVQVELQRTSELTVGSAVFEKLPTIQGPGLHLAEPKIPDQAGVLDAETIIFKYSSLLRNTSFYALYTQDPDDEDNWSAFLWRLLHECFRVGMSTEEAFIVARSSPWNKYARDGRPLEHLWRDTLKAAQEYEHVDLSTSLIRMPVLVEDDENVTPTFLDTYREWAVEATDAVPDFHDIAMLVVLSAIVSSSVKLETSAGLITPNIWGMILGDSTLTRKTTAMRLAMDFLISIDPALIVATDGTAEGLLSGLSSRPNMASIFYKDEVSGLFDSMAKKDYLAGLQETLTALYDVPPITTRRLRKEVIVIESPAFVFLCGGVPDRIHASITESFVLSGFLPRFLIIKGDAEVEDRRPLGPPTQKGLDRRPVILNKIADLYEVYATPVKQKLGGTVHYAPPRYTARMTEEAWDFNGTIETVMLHAASDSLVRDLALPTMDRLSRSMLKIAVIFAALRQRPKDDAISVDVMDIANAATYIQKWGQNSIDLVLNAGKGQHEKFLERIFEFIHAMPGALKSTIMKRFHLSSKEATAVLLTLEERGQIRKEPRGRGHAYWIN